MISKTDCALLTASLPSRSFSLEAPIFVVDKRYMRPLVILPDSSVLRQVQKWPATQHRLALSAPKFVRFIIQSDDQVQPYIKGADKAAYATFDTRTNSDAKNTPDHVCIPLTEAGYKRQAPMIRSLGEDVGIRTRQFVKQGNAHLQQA
jgi:hypothetical protein